MKPLGPSVEGHGPIDRGLGCAQGHCPLDAENTVKLFTMEKAERSKTEEYKYKTALQVPYAPLGYAPGQLFAFLVLGCRIGLACTPLLSCYVLIAGLVNYRAARCCTLAAICCVTVGRRQTPLSSSGVC